MSYKSKIQIPAIVVLLASGVANASEESWLIRINDYNPASHAFNTHGFEPFMEEVKEQTNGRVEFDLYTSQGLGKVTDTLTLLRTGQADMASAIAGFFPEAMQLSQATVAAGWDSAETGTQAMWELCQSEPFKSEFEANNIVPVFCLATPGYELLTSEEPINAIPEAFDGLRLRATGLQIEFEEAMGADAISMSSTEIYTAMERGTLDGTTLGWYTLPALSFDEVVNHATIGLGAWQAGVMFFGVSEQLWETLPSVVQDVMAEAGKKYSLEVARELDRQDNEAKVNLAGDPITVYEVSTEEREEVVEVTQRVLEEWVDEMDARGQGEAARQAVAALDSVRNIQAAPIEEWADFAY